MLGKTPLEKHMQTNTNPRKTLAQKNAQTDPFEAFQTLL